MFDLELAPVEIETKKGTQVVSVDEHPRPDTSLEKISSLRPVFKKDGVVTAANASGICDGAGESGRPTLHGMRGTETLTPRLAYMSQAPSYSHRRMR